MTQGVRSCFRIPAAVSALGVAAGLVATACTADPITQGLLVTSPHAEAAMVRRAAHQVAPSSHTDPADRANAQAVRLALEGRYAQALEKLPAPSAARRPITQRAVRHNRDVVAYWLQRRRFAGSPAMPDPHVGYAARGESSSLTVPGYHRRFRRLTQTLELDLAGIRLRLPYDAIIEQGEQDAFRGDMELTLQAFAGKASAWPDTKLTAGAIMLVHRSALCADPHEARLDLFAGAAHRRGRLVGTLLVGAPTRTGICPGPCFSGGDLWMRGIVDLVVHDVVQPTLGATASLWVADATGAATTLSPGLRWFFDARQDLRLDLLQHTTFGSVGDATLRRWGGEISAAYRW